ncbi:MAG: 16S rRNA (guanine(527)-N(7))-methyltransferase RsmG [Actinomycetota bacterium]|nr:16S rRNA (guanine(527)-N(7))-methyltransferase RsmG [Actinomycetota bacterium]
MTDFLDRMNQAAAAIGLALDPHQLEAFNKYQKKLAAANKTANLTALPEDKYIEGHFIDSLTLCLTGKLKEGQKVADIGTGAGFPGVPVKIVRPRIELHLIEANKKKADFLERLAVELGLKGVFVHRLRAEEAGRQPQLRGQMDVVMARAVASLPVLLEYALPLCRVGGWFLAMKGPKLSEETEASVRAALKLGGRIDSTIAPFEPTGEAKKVIVLVQKVEETGGRYPRRAGVPVKRPLGG